MAELHYIKTKILKNQLNLYKYIITYYYKMENLISLEIVTKNEKILSPSIFTKLQLNILKKKLQKKTLNANEKTYYYTYIKPKLKAMLVFFNISNVNISGAEFFEDNRLEKATRILKKMEKKHKNQKIMISGSFLFNKEYNDIDVFVFSKYKKEDYKQKNIHTTFLHENAFESMFFNSISKISVSNFTIKRKNDFKINIEDILQKFELIINHSLNEEAYTKELRDFIIMSEYIKKETVLNPKELFNLNNKLNRKSHEIITRILINTLILGYDENKIKTKIKERLKEYTQLKQDYQDAKNIKIYLETYSKVIELATRNRKNKDSRTVKTKNKI